MPCCPLCRLPRRGGQDADALAGQHLQSHLGPLTLGCRSPAAVPWAHLLRLLPCAFCQVPSQHAPAGYTLRLKASAQLLPPPGNLPGLSIPQAGGLFHVPLTPAFPALIKETIAVTYLWRTSMYLVPCGKQSPVLMEVTAQQVGKTLTKISQMGK